NTTEEDILQSAMDKELDAIVIADHNSGTWIDKLKIKYEAIKDESSRPLTIIPGVEITVSTGNNRVHLLGIFGTGCTSATITAILGQCGIIDGFGDANNTSTTSSIADVIKIIKENNGIAIPAHIDGEKGFLNGVMTINEEIKGVLKSISAAEFCNINDFENTNRELQKEVAKLAILAGSDAHTPSEIGKHSAWIKVSKVSKDELGIAFNDKDHYVLNQERNPNIDPDIFIKSLEIHNMKHCGRGFSSTFKMNFHSHFNAVIGGRGSGKSTSLESIRIVSDRRNELNENSEIKNHLDKFLSQSGIGVMLDDTKLILEIKRHGKEYRIHWSSASEGTDIVEEKQDNNWIQQDAGNIKERFPLNIYSQKQIHELAKNPKSLLNIIDRAINKSEWIEKWKQLKSQFMVLRERQREINRQLTLEPQIKTNLNDVINDLKQYESKGHGDVLKNYQRKLQQLKFVPLEDSFDGLARKIGEIADSAMQNDFPELQFQNDPYLTEVKKIYDETATELDDLQKGLVELVEK
ncbi:MAG: AAA family ATPase, partial [Bacteroidota bacterium]|nr:AAA family ATPase [Bacteroidota bacterium]